MWECQWLQNQGENKFNGNQWEDMDQENTLCLNQQYQINQIVKKEIGGNFTFTKMSSNFMNWFCRLLITLNSIEAEDQLKFWCITSSSANSPADG